MTAITASINVHLTIGQNIIINTTELFVSLESNLAASLSNKTIVPFDGAQIHLPPLFISNLNESDVVSLRVSYFYISSADIYEEYSSRWYNHLQLLVLLILKLIQVYQQ